MHLIPLLTLTGLITLVCCLPNPPHTSNIATPLNLTDSPSLGTYRLSKRMSYGWIGTFFLPGCATKGPLPDYALPVHPTDPEHGYVNGARPKLRVNECVDYAPQYPGKSIGVNWGAGGLSFHSLELYRSNDCSGPIDHVVRRSDHGKARGDCWSTDIYEQWDLWRSVKAKK